MIKLVLVNVSVIIIFLLNACGTLEYSVSISGNNATIEFMNKTKLECEIISFADSSLIFSPIRKIYSQKLTEPILYSISYGKIKSIEIKGLVSSDWVTSVLLFQAIPVALLTIAASVYSEEFIPEIPVILGIPVALTAILLSSSDEKTPEWNNSMSNSDLDSLKIFSRYPAKLTEDEINKLLSKIGQTELKDFRINLKNEKY